jgi:hypothetical protein
MDNLLVILIVIVAGAYSIRGFYKRLKTKQDCCYVCLVCTVETPLRKKSEISGNDIYLRA